MRTLHWCIYAMDQEYMAYLRDQIVERLRQNVDKCLQKTLLCRLYESIQVLK